MTDEGLYTEMRRHLARIVEEIDRNERIMIEHMEGALPWLASR